MTWKIGHPGTFATHNANFITDDNNDAVAEIYGIPQHTTLEDAKLIERAQEGLRNAYKISATNELLSVCEKLILYDESPASGVVDHYQIYENLIKSARAAIAKAKGEA